MFVILIPQFGIEVFVACVAVTKDTVCAGKHDTPPDHLSHDAAYGPNVHWNT